MKMSLMTPETTKNAERTFFFPSQLHYRTYDQEGAMPVERSEGGARGTGVRYITKRGPERCLYTPPPPHTHIHTTTTLFGDERAKRMRDRSDAREGNARSPGGTPGYIASPEGAPSEWSECLMTNERSE